MAPSQQPPSLPRRSSSNPSVTPSLVTALDLARLWKHPLTLTDWPACPLPNARNSVTCLHPPATSPKEISGHCFLPASASLCALVPAASTERRSLLLTPVPPASSPETRPPQPGLPRSLGPRGLPPGPSAAFVAHRCPLRGHSRSSALSPANSWTS